MSQDLTTIEVDQFYPHPPSKVWRALTEPELIAQWLMPGDFRLEIGHRYTMRSRPVAATGFSGLVEAEVLAFEPEKLLRLAWRDAGEGNTADWTLTWTLHPEGHGTRLILLHEGFDPDDPLQRQAHTIMNGGWRTGVPKALAAVLATW
ncbi:Activator of Hsp90 ATPase 1 family protein [Kribbella flavida DSM 17836]|uniref:Activator of Hsp90 ATPase 1 family protein n=1 Tax=Kribbella flavida (strain DSM 17836 / JCM 10339 / NBRC 14399) TaxID=479435 RepID=D2Q3A4_KRIFD|nr:SRPBCC domain-containing protein [Kribbella flavida]ADB32229.1 Activator of Hsp90 ATPase 1 family protein [Kribbella flavida DSM 17836]